MPELIGICLTQDPGVADLNPAAADIKYKFSEMVLKKNTIHFFNVTDEEQSFTVENSIY